MSLKQQNNLTARLARPGRRAEPDSRTEALPGLLRPGGVRLHLRLRQEREGGPVWPAEGDFGGRFDRGPALFPFLVML